MKFESLPLRGAYLIQKNEITDSRGYFTRTYCAEAFRENGLQFTIEQCNLSFSSKRGTLRGMHYQNPPYSEIKLVSCIRGSIFDCIVDIRKDSETYLKHFAIELNALGPMLYVPEGFAHGFQTLEDESVVEYKVSAAYSPGNEGGLRWNDPALRIDWPYHSDRTISSKDLSHPLIYSKQIGFRSQSRRNL